ncbi:MAG: hypothetical protein Fur0010_21440 [Bdellovibrio sp.]
MNFSIKRIYSTAFNDPKLLAELKHLDQYFPFPWSEQAWSMLGDNSAHHLGFVLYQHERTIGFCLYGLNPDQVAHLYKIIVHPDFRRQGLSRRLFDSSLKELMALAFHSIFLEVEADNLAANNLYTSLGFKKLHTAKNFYGQGRHANKMMLEILNT